MLCLEKMREFQEKVIDDVAEFYAGADAAHGLPHVWEVVKAVETICSRLCDFRHWKVATIAAAYHDIFALNREHHHVDAYTYVRSNVDKFRSMYAISEEDVNDIAFAVLEHRNSWGGGYYSMVSEIVAAADRGIPTNESLINCAARPYLYGREQLGYSIDEAKEHTIMMLRKKFGRDTLGSVPEWYRGVFKDELELRFQLAETINVDWFTADRVAHFEKQLTAAY